MPLINHYSRGRDELDPVRQVLLYPPCCQNSLPGSSLLAFAVKTFSHSVSLRKFDIHSGYSETVKFGKISKKCKGKEVENTTVSKKTVT